MYTYIYIYIILICHVSTCHCQMANKSEAVKFFEVALGEMDKIVLYMAAIKMINNYTQIITYYRLYS